MELLRYGHDVWGERVLNGASWELIPAAFWAGVAVIVIHLVYRAVRRRGHPKPAAASSRAAGGGSGG